MCCQNSNAAAGHTFSHLARPLDSMSGYMKPRETTLTAVVKVWHHQSTCTMCALLPQAYPMQQCRRNQESLPWVGQRCRTFSFNLLRGLLSDALVLVLLLHKQVLLI
jgi:hypothetical protein